jgi:PAS domain S-box-containing protein
MMDVHECLIVSYLIIRERNREHAKRSRVRKKFLLESLQHSVRALEEENEKLRGAIREHLKDDADHLLSRCTFGGPSVIATDPQSATRTLDDPDYSLVKALQTAQQNFVISDPALPDNPIVYASQGFLSLTGYTLNEVLGRNCRFLQGPETDPRAVDRIRAGIERGEDTTVVLLNYRKDGTVFWNQFFVAALRDGDSNVVNYLGVQCKVSEDYAKAFVKSEEQDK